MSGHNAYNLYVKDVVGHFVVVRACRLCQFVDSRRRPRPGSAPARRGNGFVEGNKQRGRLIEHLKVFHPAEYAAAMKDPSTAPKPKAGK